MLKIKNKRSYKNKLGAGGSILFIILVIYAIIILYPLFWMVMSSMKSYGEIYNSVWNLPEKWLFTNYLEAWDKGISNYFINSVIVTVSTITGVLIIGSLCAYALSRYKSRGINIALIACMTGMMVNPQVALIPLYLLLQKLGIHNTRLALILPYIALRLPLSVLLIRSYFLGIPKEIEESARMDGCSSFGIYSRIFMPMSKPILFTTVVLTAFYAWNEFLFAIIFIDSDRLKTIPSGLMNFRDALQTEWGVLLAGMVISALPMIILLMVLQKHLVRGMSEGSIKG
ncbi:carbohydrate ABC transporter permease [Alkaliphilus peptidifermentans]|uniref:Raffinose/stachyose/melibiose transport system permease protein n=1 Tax=Alkaliphilus peptidifermentans DSM 18978 TaxID=1120976 RepID=A0A1G5HSH2_9FIRM|nr:carbohydrate ABC transporter permease [Alkaliphilus peptidifermentans]SCY66240.1 raffinose/stachyose/melibiose transport system permease protein [Alkaliphilus peptidifermentans DSM 18978]